MGETCENYLSARAYSAKAEKQLDNFKKRSKTVDSDFEIAGTYACPSALKNCIYNRYGLDIIKYKAGDPSDLKEYLKYKWILDAGITDLDQLVKYLVEKENADLAIGKTCYDNLQKYGAITEGEWCEKNWGTSCIYDQKILWDDSDSFVVNFLSRNSPPDIWLKKVSKDFPDIHFSLDWELAFIGDGIYDVVNGSFLGYPKFSDIAQAGLK